MEHKKKRRVVVTIPPNNKFKDGMRYIGLFHRWADSTTFIDNQTIPITVGLVENIDSGKIVSIRPNNIRFIKEREILDYNFNKI